QGIEAGGHRATFTGVDVSTQPGLFSLLPQMIDAVTDPVIAAGGIADGRTAAAAFVLGASAVQLGTAFLRCEEADVRDAHRAALAEELSPNVGDGLRVQAAAVWGGEDAGLAATSIPSVNLTP